MQPAALNVFLSSWEGLYETPDSPNYLYQEKSILWYNFPNKTSKTRGVNCEAYIKIPPDLPQYLDHPWHLFSTPNCLFMPACDAILVCMNWTTCAACDAILVYRYMNCNILQRWSDWPFWQCAALRAQGRQFYCFFIDGVDQYTYPWVFAWTFGSYLSRYEFWRHITMVVK